MKAEEAVAQGFYYTGMGSAAYEFDTIKEEAMKIKKAYKGADFRIIEKRCQSRCGSVRWKIIYGNKIFREVMHFKPTQEEQYLNNHEVRLAKLKEMYLAKVEAENEEFKNRKDKYDFLMSIKK